MTRSHYEAALDCLAQYHRQRMRSSPVEIQGAIRCQRRAYLAALNRHEGALPVLLALAPRHGNTAIFTRLVHGRKPA